MDFFTEFLPFLALFVLGVFVWEIWGQPALGGTGFFARLIVAIGLLIGSTLLFTSAYRVIAIAVMMFGMLVIPPVFKDPDS